MHCLEISLTDLHNQQAASDLIWATCLAICKFEELFQDRKIEWELVVKKGKQFVKSKETVENFGMYDVLENAKQFLKCNGIK